MNIVDPWLDTAELKHIAQQLLKRNAADPESPPATKITPTAQLNPEKQSTPEHPATHQEKMPLTDAEIDQHTIDRLTIIQNWLLKSFPIKNIFVLRTPSGFLIGRPEDEKLHALARELTKNLPAGELAAKELPSGHHLQTFSTEAQQTHLTLGLTTAEPLRAFQTDMIYKILSLACQTPPAASKAS